MLFTKQPINLSGLSPQAAGDHREVVSMLLRGLITNEHYTAWANAKPAVATVEVETKLPPMSCKVCSYHNEYVGKEHLTPEGAYVCRTCRPCWDRKGRVEALKEEAAANEDKRLYPYLYETPFQTNHFIKL